MNLVLQRIEQDEEFARRVLKNQKDFPALYRNKAISSHISIALEHWMKESTAVLLMCTKHEVVAQEIFNHLIKQANPNDTVLSGCAQHLNIAQHLTQNTSEKVQAACSTHKELLDFYISNNSPYVIANLIRHEIKLAFEHFNSKNTLIRRSCAFYESIAKKLAPIETSSMVQEVIASHYNIAIKEHLKAPTPHFLNYAVRFRDIAEKHINSPFNSVRAECAKHASLAAHFLRDSSWNVRKEVAHHKELQHQMVQDPEPFIRTVVATNPNLCTHLVKDKDRMVCLEVATNPFSAKLMANHNDREVAARAKLIDSIW